MPTLSHDSVAIYYTERIAAFAPNAELAYRWREPEVVQETVTKVRDFLSRHKPDDE